MRYNIGRSIPCNGTRRARAFLSRIKCSFLFSLFRGMKEKKGKKKEKKRKKEIRDADRFLLLRTIPFSFTVFVYHFSLSPLLFLVLIRESSRFPALGSSKTESNGNSPIDSNEARLLHCTVPT